MLFCNPSLYAGLTLRVHLIVLTLLLWLCGASPAQAIDHIVEQSYAKDQTGTWDIAYATKQPTQPFTGLLTQGFGTEVLWVRLRIDPARSGAAAQDTLFLRMRPIFWDYIQLFDEAEGFVPRPPVGDRYPLSAQDEPANFYLLKIRAGNEPRDLWLRLQSTNSRFMYFEVLNESHLRQSNLQIQSLSGVYLALMTVFLLVGLNQLMIHRTPLNWLFTLYLTMALSHGVVILGYGRLWLAGWIAPEFFDRIFSFMVVCLTGTVLLFSYYLLKELSYSRRRKIIYGGFACVLFGLLCLQWAGNVPLSLKLNAITALLLPVVFLIDAALAQPDPSRSARGTGLSKNVMVFYFGLTLLFVHLAAWPTLGWAWAVEFTIYAILFYSLTSGLLMLGILQYRAHLFNKQRNTLLNETRVANDRAELERFQRLERERLLAMLGHELKTPLATLKMMLGDKKIPTDTAHQLNEPLSEINELIERTVQSGQLENKAIGLRVQTVALLQVLQDTVMHLDERDRLQWMLPPDMELNTVESDPFLLGMLMRNLIDNAFKYSPAGTPIEVILLPDNGKKGWIIEVRNAVGRAGFPDPERVFDKYWRSPDASYRSGSGQGLFIASRLAELMGGRLSYQRIENKVCFELKIPSVAPKESTLSA
jgi:two-component system, sensor histidine kinase LadS